MYMYIYIHILICIYTYIEIYSYTICIYTHICTRTESARAGRPQVYLNKGAGYKAHTDIPFQRTLTDDFPRQQYRRRQNEQKTVIHWGQRKLLMSEIEFLTMYGKPGHPVVYAGAAPGTHIKHLAQLFPELDFVLVDPAPFNLKETAQVTLRQELFTDAVAAEFTGRAPLFISDIRAADWQEMGEEENEKQVQSLIYIVLSLIAWYLTDL